MAHVKVNVGQRTRQVHSTVFNEDGCSGPFLFFDGYLVNLFVEGMTPQQQLQACLKPGGGVRESHRRLNLNL